MLLGDIRPRDIRAVLDAAVVAGKKQQTVGHIRATIFRVLKRACEDEIIPSNPAALTKTPNLRETKRDRAILADDEIAQFFGCEDVDMEIRVMGLVARCEGGMRTRDVTAWDWTMIDRGLFASCTIPRTKTRDPQRLDIPGVLQVPLRRWWVKQGCPASGPVFPVTKGKRKGEARKERGVSFAKRLRRALRVAGIDRPELFEGTIFSQRVDFHSFRRAFSTALADAGVNAQRAQHLTGHADPRAHARYVMRSKTMQAIPAAALPRLVPNWSLRPEAPGAAPKSSMIPERDTRFELATLSLGS
jgi:integrase